MQTPSSQDLSRRERQIMDILFERGQASAAEVQDAMPDAPSYSAVRTFLRILEEKGHLVRRKQGACFVYAPLEPRSEAAQSALARVVKTFFDSNVERTVAALLSSQDVRLSAEELDRLAQLIEEARAEEEQA
jgi:predicted transcriptional regulator